MRAMRSPRFVASAQSSAPGARSTRSVSSAWPCAMPWSSAMPTLTSKTEGCLRIENLRGSLPTTPPRLSTNGNHTIPPGARAKDFLIPPHPLRPLSSKLVSFHDLAHVPGLGLERDAANAESASPAQVRASVMSNPPPDFRAIYDAHFDFVWRAL